VAYERVKPNYIGRQSSDRAAAVRHHYPANGINANYIQEFGSYFTEITFRVHNKDQSVNDVQGIKRRLL
jgi:hypothetical protein